MTMIRRNFFLVLRILLLLSTLFFVSNTFVHAQTDTSNYSNEGRSRQSTTDTNPDYSNEGRSGTAGNGGGTQGNGGGANNPRTSTGVFTLTNPLKATSVEGLIYAIIDIILILVQPIIILFIVYGGFLFVTARGDEGKVTKARAALTWAIIGGVVVLGARALIAVIQGTVASL